MPVRGKQFTIKDMFNEISDRQDKIKKENKKTRLVNQEQSIKMLMEEEKTAQEVDMAQKIAQELNQISNMRLQTGFTNVTSQNGEEIYNKAQKEPLITKAYDAFRKHKSVHKQAENLVPTEAYIMD